VLAKGGHGSLQVHDTSVRVSWDDSSKMTTLVRTRRVATRRVPDVQRTGALRQRLDRFEIERPWREHAERPLYRLPPHESTTFTCYTTVPRSALCTVEVALVGVRWPGRRMGQWLMSLVSPPAES
jgi:hypothetical protein